MNFELTIQKYVKKNKWSIQALSLNATQLSKFLQKKQLYPYEPRLVKEVDILLYFSSIRLIVLTRSFILYLISHVPEGSRTPPLKNCIDNTLECFATTNGRSKNNSGEIKLS